MTKCHFCENEATGKSDTRLGLIPTCDLCGGMLEPMTDREARIAEALPSLLDGISASCYAGVPVNTAALAWRMRWQDAESRKPARVILRQGRWFLVVDGLFLAMQGDPCRDPVFFSKLWDYDSLVRAASLINGEGKIPEIMLCPQCRQKLSFSKEGHLECLPCRMFWPTAYFRR